MSFSSDYYIESRALLGATAAFIWCQSGDHPNQCFQPAGALLEYGMSITDRTLLAGSPGRALIVAFSLKKWTAFLDISCRLAEPFAEGEVVESGGQRRAAFFPIILRMLAEGYRT